MPERNLNNPSNSEKINDDEEWPMEISNDTTNIR